MIHLGLERESKADDLKEMYKTSPGNIFLLLFSCAETKKT